MHMRTDIPCANTLSGSHIHRYTTETCNSIHTSSLTCTRNRIHALLHTCIKPQSRTYSRHHTPTPYSHTQIATYMCCAIKMRSNTHEHSHSTHTLDSPLGGCMGVVGLCALLHVAVAVGARRSRLYLPKARRSGVTLLPWNLLTAVAIVRMSACMYACMYVAVAGFVCSVL